MDAPRHAVARHIAGTRRAQEQLHGLRAARHRRIPLIMNRYFTLHRHVRLRAMLVAFCAVMILAATTPCAMAVDLPSGTEIKHDCPHCPPQPCHDASTDPDCDGLNPADKPRNDSGGDVVAAVAAHMSGATLPRPARAQAPAVGPPPVRDGPRRHLILATFNE